MTKEELLFHLLRLEIAGAETPIAADDVSNVLITETLRLARLHSIGHLIADALLKTDLVLDESQIRICEQNQFSAAAEDSRQNYEIERLKMMLNHEKIPFVMLKGAVLQHWYPKTWMRNSCDIDVLVKEADLERSISLLTQQAGYVLQGRSDHDVTLVLGNTHVELHFLLDRAKRSGDILRAVWDYVTPVGDSSECVMTDELFYFYHIAHMAKHIKSAGCGIRSFIDVWILNHKMDSDPRKRRELLAAGGLLTVADAASALAEVWLSGASHTPLTRDFEQYVLYSGVYGNMHSKVTMSLSHKKGWVFYCLSRVFLPYRSMRLSYPVLQRYPVLLPMYWVVRAFRILFTADGRMNAAAEVAVNVKKEYMPPEYIRCLMHNLDL